MKKVLFLCTGNYYRSRFAEIYFNEIARKQNCDWEGFSRGLNVVPGKNHGPISPHTIEGLKKCGIDYKHNSECPKQVTTKDVEEADRIVAVKKTEHQDYILKLLPSDYDQVVYWEIHDVDIEHPSIALKQLKAKVEKLIDELKK